MTVVFGGENKILKIQEKTGDFNHLFQNKYLLFEFKILHVRIVKGLQFPNQFEFSIYL